MTELKNNDTKSKATLVYYYDALCGWCYGFSPVISKVQQAFGDQFDYEVISGGLFLDQRAGYVNEVAPHIKAGAYKTVELRTGVKFGEAFLKDVFGEGKLVLNSLFPSIALCIVKEKFPEKELAFAEALLKAVYAEGKNPVDLDQLASCAANIGFNEAEFKTKMQDSQYETAARNEFERFRTSKFRGMPALLLEINGQQIPLSNGYVDFDNLQQRLNQILEQSN